MLACVRGGGGEGQGSRCQAMDQLCASALPFGDRLEGTTTGAGLCVDVVPDVCVCVCARALCCCSDQLLGCVNVELAKMGQAPVNDVEQAAFMAFAKSVYHPSVDTPSSAISDVSAFSLAGLSAVLAGGS